GRRGSRGAADRAPRTGCGPRPGPRRPADGPAGRADHHGRWRVLEPVRPNRPRWTAGHRPVADAHHAAAVGARAGHAQGRRRVPGWGWLGSEDLLSLSTRPPVGWR